MSSSGFRPVFEYKVSTSQPQALQQMRRALEDSDAPIRWKFVGSHLVIWFDDSQRHFWSPWFDVELRDDSGQTRIFGRFSPHPSIWTGFMLAWLASLVLFFFSLVVGISQQLIAQQPWGYYLLPVWLGVALVLWLVARTGQRLAESEMQLLRQLLDKALPVEVQGPE
jgi:hypothetical protein